MRLIVFFSLAFLLLSCQTNSSVDHLELTYLKGILDDSFEEKLLHDSTGTNDDLQAVLRLVEQEKERLQEGGFVPEGYKVAYAIDVRGQNLYMVNAGIYLEESLSREKTGQRHPKGIRL
ncbi:MAG: hypothetical protein AAFQ98_06240 [Bacteroidota bacterium]